MKCENCKEKHDGSYGSGRFCSKKCAKGFSTKAKRKEINKKVSEKLKGSKGTTGSFKKGYDERRMSTSESRKQAVKTNKKRLDDKYEKMDFKDIPINRKKLRILENQNNACGECGLSEWNGKPLVLEWHHIDGDHDNEYEENFKYLCPNCHSQTPNWRRMKSSLTEN